MFTLSERFDDKGEVEEADEEHVELFEAGEDSSEAFESSEQPFDFVALLVVGSVVVPGFDAVGLGRNHQNHAQIEHQLPRLIALIGPIHRKRVVRLSITHNSVPASLLVITSARGSALPP